MKGLNLLEGSNIVLEFNGVVAQENSDTYNLLPVLDIFTLIDHLINMAYYKIIIHIPQMESQTTIEEWLIKQHPPMLIYLTIKSVEVTNIIPKYAAYIGPRAIRFTQNKDIERYLI